jgi:hypothetical protein
MGCYQEGLAKDSVAGKDVAAHIFELVAHRSLLVRPNPLTHTPQIYVQRHRYRYWRSIHGCMPGPDHLLPEGTEQKEAE